MPRTTVRVRRATANDVERLVHLDSETREILPSLNGRSSRHVAVAEALADASRYVLIAESDDGDALGMATVAVGPLSPLMDVSVVHMDHVVVADRHRRRGAGRALVAAAASYAEEAGVDRVVVSVVPGARDANRFFARLGFAPLVMRRVAPVGVIRRRLADIDSDPADVTNPKLMRGAVRRRVLARRQAPRLRDESQPGPAGI